MEDAVQTVMTQCELWTDNNDMEREEKIVDFKLTRCTYQENAKDVLMVAEKIHMEKQKNNKYSEYI